MVAGIVDHTRQAYEFTLLTKQGILWHRTVLAHNQTDLLQMK